MSKTQRIGSVTITMKKQGDRWTVTARQDGDSRPISASFSSVKEAAAFFAYLVRIAYDYLWWTESQWSPKTATV